ncbi:sodium-dependent transporter [Exiguobacterium sp. CH10]|jgi:NSS family neurotransmitter:Na+ symporter|uniref:sodium-dependent transporter n=1 Tax=Exiguobacterium sp. CH10 TaxID=2751261 RepID=UPI001BEC2FA3|nr:sodium-dependent transporter [Exiguobacterium sp. CH10]
MAQNSFASKIGFILAAAGSAIGLGAIWKFPYVTGTSGGGAFLLMFLAFTLLLGLPLLIGEFIVGRSTQKTALLAFKKLGHGRWSIIGYLGVIACFLLLSFYSVIGGWVLIYIGLGLSGTLSGRTADEFGDVFGNVVSTPGIAVLGQFLFLLITLLIVLRGVEAGIERMSKILMPLLFISFIVLVVRSLTLDGAMEGVRFFLQPDFSALTGESVLFALGQAFFSLSLGVAAMLTYASYIKTKGTLNRSANMIVLLNITVSLLAGLAIFPAVFASGLDPAEGPALLFVVLPAVFNQVPLGGFFMVLFFLLFAFASITSSIAMLEVVVAGVTDRLNEKKSTWTKKQVTVMAAILVFVVGVPSALSFGLLSDLQIWNGRTFFDTMDYLVSYILMPIGALLTSIFVGYVVDQRILKDEIQTSEPGKKLYPIWHALIRYVIPVTVAIVMVSTWVTT